MRMGLFPSVMMVVSDYETFFCLRIHIFCCIIIGIVIFFANICDSKFAFVQLWSQKK